MKNTPHSIAGPTIAILLALIAGVLVYVQYTWKENVRPEFNKYPTQVKEQIRYISTPYQFAFAYPTGYYMKENQNAGTAERPQLSIVMVADTQINRDLLDGKITEPMEGPPSITVTAYPNPKKLPSEEWAKQDTNWMISSKKLTQELVGGKSGISFTWDGLCRGKSIVVTSSDHAYVFEVTWMSPEDDILKDFNAILDSISFKE